MDNTAGRIRRFSRIWERLGEDVANIDKHHQLIQGIFGATGSAAVLYDGLGEGDKSRLSDLDFENLVFALTVWSIKRLSPQPVSSPHGNLPLGKVVHSW